MSLWTPQELAEATGGQLLGDWGTIFGVSIDSRTLEPGDLFVALTVARDAHDFVAGALEAGAAGAMVSHVPEGLAPGEPLLLVPDVQAGLEALGRSARARFRGRVIAVTGSVGKTSTKEMLRTVLSGQGDTHASVASYNNHWGVPLTLARMPRDARFAVIEIGMNHPGEIAPLARMAAPHVAIVTTVAPAHLAAFENLDGIAREKASIFQGLQDGGVAIYHGDLGVSEILKAEAGRHARRVVSFGQARHCHHRATHVRIQDSVTVAHGRAWRTPLLYKIEAPGRHFAINGLAAMAVVQALRLDRAIAAADLGRWRPVEGRGQREAIQLDPVDTHLTLDLIDDAYNANPASMGASLEVLAAASVKDGIGRVHAGRRIAYLGDMKELGAQETDLHADLASHPAMADLDVVHCVGPLMKALYDALPPEKRGRWKKTSQGMARGVARELDAGDVVLAKGSLSMGLSRVVDAVRAMGHARFASATEEEL